MKGTLSVAAVLLSSLLQPPDLFPSESTPIDTTAGIRAIAARALAVGDLDLDGSDDVVVTNLFGWAVCVFLADGTQSYTPVWHYGTEAGPFSVALGDLNNDGVPDIVAVSGTNGNVFVLLGNGDGTFEEAGTYHSGIRTLPSSQSPISTGTVPSMCSLPIRVARPFPPCSALAMAPSRRHAPMIWGTFPSGPRTPSLSATTKRRASL